MTVTSELLPPTTLPAPARGPGNAISQRDIKPEKTDSNNIDLSENAGNRTQAPADSVRDQFRDYLARETGNQTSVIQIPDGQSANSDVPAVAPGLIDNPARAGEAVPQATAENGVIQDKIRIVGQAPARSDARPESKFPPENEVSQQPAGQILQKQVTDITAAIEEATPRTTIADKETTPRTAPADKETTPRTTPVDNRSESDVSLIMADAQAPVSVKNPDLSETVTPEAGTPIVVTAETITPETLKDTSSFLNISAGGDIPEDKKAANQNNVTQTEENKVPSLVDPKEVAPAPALFSQQTIVPSSVIPSQQPTVVAALSPAGQNKSENSKVDKNSPENSPENIRQNIRQNPVRENPVPVARDKENATTLADAVKTPQISATSKNSTEGPQDKPAQDKPAQDKPTVANSPQPESLRPALLTRTDQLLPGGEGKIAGGDPAQTQAGLLSLQEVNPGSGQVRNLTSPGQVAANAPLNSPSVNPQIVAKQISLAIAKQTGEGKDSFKITLKPAELGQVDIKMDIQADGRITATIAVDNKQTLNLLHRDQGLLQKALANSGFDAGGNSLNFTLRHQQQNPAQSGNAGNLTGDGEDDFLTALSEGNIIHHQQMKMIYSDNILDINI